jgi:hypothetical protein
MNEEKIQFSGDEGKILFSIPTEFLKGDREFRGGTP